MRNQRAGKVFVAAAISLAFVTAPAAAAWEPTKPVEIVVAAGAGGASDQMARMMQAAIQKNNLMKQPVVVSLKGGASGAEALTGAGRAQSAAPAGAIRLSRVTIGPGGRAGPLSAVTEAAREARRASGTFPAVRP